MTARRGQDWGGPATTRPDVVVATDRELGRLLDNARGAGRELGPVGLLGGDLCRTLGGRGDQARLYSDHAIAVTVDIGRADADDHSGWFVAHCIARRRWWGAGSVAVMNAAFLGAWNMAPRAHPNDGRLDVIESSLSAADRWKARRRLPLGTHVPHPDIDQRRVTVGEWTFRRPRSLRLDGHTVGRTRTLRVTIEPDALEVVI
ncbi:MAG: hypothetical protein OES57_17090 [Acidimicrobiia bacterium]|nr:hypothetical protein [Acidimicrobiia bacterium]